MIAISIGSDFRYNFYGKGIAGTPFYPFMDLSIQLNFLSIMWTIRLNSTKFNGNIGYFGQIWIIQYPFFRRSMGYETTKIWWDLSIPKEPF